MADLSPKLLERRRLREQRSRPWKDDLTTPPTPSNISTSTGPVVATPSTPSNNGTLSTSAVATSPASARVRVSLPLAALSATPTPRFRASLPARTRVTEPSPMPYKRCTALCCPRASPRFRRVGPFPFMKLPFELQVLVGQFVVLDKQPLRCEDFVPSKDGKPDKSRKVRAKRALSKEGHPIWIPFLKVCPWLAKDLSRTWYSCNAFFVRNVPEWKAFAARASSENVDRITRLHVDNDFVYCLGPTVGENKKWYSWRLLADLKNLKTLTLFRCDGGPGTLTDNGRDDFNSIKWFVEFSKKNQALRRINFSLYPWADQDAYPLVTSNMVIWIKDWQYKWDRILAPRRDKKDAEDFRTWYATSSRLSRSEWAP